MVHERGMCQRKICTTTGFRGIKEASAALAALFSYLTSRILSKGPTGTLAGPSGSLDVAQLQILQSELLEVVPLKVLGGVREPHLHQAQGCMAGGGTKER